LQKLKTPPKDAKNQLFEDLIVEMLAYAGHKVNFKSIQDWKKETPWYQYYTIKKGRMEKFKEEIFLPRVQKAFKINKDSAEKEWGWFNLMYGLKEI